MEETKTTAATISEVVQDEAAAVATKVSRTVAGQVAEHAEHAVETGIVAGIDKAIDIIQTNEEQLAWQARTTEQLFQLTATISELSLTLNRTSAAVPLMENPIENPSQLALPLEVAPVSPPEVALGPMAELVAEAEMPAEVGLANLELPTRSARAVKRWF